MIAPETPEPPSGVPAAATPPAAASRVKVHGPPRPAAPKPPQGRVVQQAASVGQALGGSEPLGALLARLAQSQARWAVVAAGLPPELAAVSRPGPLDDQAWTILADHASAAAKLRQLLPDIAIALSAQGWASPPVRIKVRPRGS